MLRFGQDGNVGQSCEFCFDFSSQAYQIIVRLCRIHTINLTVSCVVPVFIGYRNISRPGEKFFFVFIFSTQHRGFRGKRSWCISHSSFVIRFSLRSSYVPALFLQLLYLSPAGRPMSPNQGAEIVRGSDMMAGFRSILGRPSHVCIPNTKIRSSMVCFYHYKGLGLVWTGWEE